MASPDKGSDFLSRALQRAGLLAPDEADEAIGAGRVNVDGQTLRNPMAWVSLKARVRVDGRDVSLEPRTLALMFHKPADSVTTRGTREGTTVFDLLLPQLTPELARFHWHAVGRLDRDATGLLLFTNDERLLAHVTSPESRLPKRYRAKVGSDVTPQKLERLERAAQVDGFAFRPGKATRVGPREVVLEIIEGKNHQVKRMLGAAGLPVLALHREAIGAVALDVLEPGRYRQLSEDEVRVGLSFAAR